MRSNDAVGQKSARAVQTDRLSKSFGSVIALHDVTIEVPYGQCLSVIGPNGAGKTTLIRIMATLSRPTAGQVRVDGLDVQEWGSRVRGLVGFAGHDTLLYPYLTAVENLRFYGRMYGVPEVERRISELLVQFELTGLENETTKALSRGMLQRLSLARAMLHKPRILLLDEAYASLDAHATDLVDTVLSDLCAQGGAVVLTTHDTRRVADIASQVLILVDGQVACRVDMATASAEDLRDLYRQHTGSRR